MSGCDHLLPTDPGDVSKIPEIAKLDQTAFASLVPPLLSLIKDPKFYGSRSQVRKEILNILTSRAAEEPTAAELQAALTLPFETPDQVRRASAILWSVMMDLPLDKLALFRPRIAVLAASTPAPSEDEDDLRDRHDIVNTSKDLLSFIDDPTIAWAPRKKFDPLAYRSLTERVHTAEQMRPHVPRLLEWLADPNWPPFQPCWEQLCRFPEEAVGPIVEILEKERGDGGWAENLLLFVDERVSVGPAWESLRPELQRMVAEPVGSEADWDVKEIAEKMLRELDAWKRKASRE